MAAIVAEGDFGNEAMGGGGLPRGVGRSVRGARALVLKVKSFADCVAEVLRALLLGLGEIHHALAVAHGHRRGAACKGPPGRMGRPPTHRAHRRSAEARAT